jgi:hypothetical protein
LSKSFFRVDLKMPCEVHHGEQEVAKLFCLPLRILFAVKLGQFLVDLVSRS